MKKELNKEMKTRKFTFPPQEEFERVVQRISKSDKRTNMGLAPNATAAEKAKYNLCKSIGRFERENSLTEQELAKKLGITHPQVEKILFCHIDKLNLEELINLVESLAVPLEMKINSKYD
jgi:predicted XRE-type DNA-binding protein